MFKGKKTLQNNKNDKKVFLSYQLPCLSVMMYVKFIQRVYSNLLKKYISGMIFTKVT